MPAPLTAGSSKPPSPAPRTGLPILHIRASLWTSRILSQKTISPPDTRPAYRPPFGSRPRRRSHGGSRTPVTVIASWVSVFVSETEPVGDCCGTRSPGHIIEWTAAASSTQVLLTGPVGAELVPVSHPFQSERTRITNDLDLYLTPHHAVKCRDDRVYVLDVSPITAIRGPPPHSTTNEQCIVGKRVASDCSPRD